MNKRWLLAAGILTIVASKQISPKTVFACAGNGCNWPTHTPYPTPTLFPTWTPYPTEKPLPTGAPETGPEDNLVAVPLALAMGALGLGMRKWADKIW